MSVRVLGRIWGALNCREQTRVVTRTKNSDSGNFIYSSNTLIWVHALPYYVAM